MSLSISSAGSAVRTFATGLMSQPAKTSFYVGVTLIGASVFGAVIHAVRQRNANNNQVPQPFVVSTSLGVVLTVPFLLVKSRLFSN